MRKRIYYVKMDSSGTFPDGRIKMDTSFRSEDGQELIWTPPWRAIIDLSASAKYLEETNKPYGEWNHKLDEAYRKLQETTEISKNIIETANNISANLGNTMGDKKINRLFQGIPSELDKTRQIYYVLSSAKDVDDFIVKLAPIIDVHRKIFTDPFKEKFNLILKKLGLRLDETLNIIKV